MSCGRPTFELPGDAPPGCSGPPSRTSGLQARQGAQHFAHLRRTGIKIPAPLQQSSPGTSPRRPLPPLLSSLRRQVVCVGAKCNAFDRRQVSTVLSRVQPQCRAGSLAGRAAKLRVGPVPNTSSADKLPRKCLCLFLQGKAGQARPWLSPARYSSATLPGRSPSKMLRAAGVRPLKGRWRRQCRDKPATDCAGTPASTSRPSASIRRAVPASEVPFYLAPASVRRSQVGRSGPGPGGRLSAALSVGLGRGLGAQGLPALAPPKPARGSHSRPPPGPTLRYASGPWSLADLQAGPAPNASSNPPTSPALPPLPTRLPTTKGDLWAPARRPVRIRASCHAPAAAKGIKTYNKGAAA